MILLPMLRKITCCRGIFSRRIFIAYLADALLYRDNLYDNYCMQSVFNRLLPCMDNVYDSL